VDSWRGPGVGEDYPVYRIGQTTTVFDPAWKLYDEGQLPVWGSVLARSQTKGRGRFGRPWCSPPGHVYAALRLPVAAPFDGPSASVALALLISLALEELFSLKTLIKWPNDIVMERKKVGGLLLEARRGTIIGGIGLNLISPPVWAPSEPGLDKGKAQGTAAKKPGDESGQDGGQDGSHDGIQDGGQGHGGGQGTGHGVGHGEGQGEGQGEYLAPLVAGALPIYEGPGGLWPKLVEKMLVCYNLNLTRPDHPPFGAKTPMDLATERLLGLGHTVAVLSPSTEPPFHDRVLAGTLIGLGSSGALLIENDHGTFAVWSGSLYFEF
jgi:hypothetical protein